VKIAFGRKLGLKRFYQEANLRRASGGKGGGQARACKVAARNFQKGNQKVQRGKERMEGLVKGCKNVPQGGVIRQRSNGGEESAKAEKLGIA